MHFDQKVCGGCGMARGRTRAAGGWIHVAALAALIGGLPACSTRGGSAAVGTPRVDAHLRGLVPGGFSGAALVARDGQVQLARGYGMANRERALAFTAETPSYIGSITKQFTAAAVLKLQDEGKLSVTDSLARFFVDVPADKRGITLHQLLVHGGGLSAYVPGERSDAQPREREDAVRAILTAPLVSAPGERFAYSNSGYVLLAAVIETVSGVGYEAFLRDRLFRPAGMARTGSTPVGWKPGEIATAYAQGAPLPTPERRWMADGPSWNLRGAGGLVSTVGDLHRWSRALHTGSVISAAARASMLRAHLQADPEGKASAGYGGVLITMSSGKPVFAVAGGDDAYNAVLVQYLDEPVVVAGLANVAEHPIEGQVPALDALMWNLRTPAPGTAADSMSASELLASPAGPLVSSLLAAIASGDEAAITAFIDKTFTREFRADFPMEGHVGEFRRMHQSLGCGEVTGAVRAGDDLRVRLRSATDGGAYVLSLELSSGPEPRIAGIQLRRDAATGK